MIISGGENVYAAEVESAIVEHPSVAEAAVIGVPDARWGEAVHAVLVLNPGASLDKKKFQGWCRERRSEEQTSELQSLMRISYAVFCLKKTTHYLITNSHLLIQTILQIITILQQ